MKEFVHKNEVTLIGTAAAAPTVSHENHEARFVKFPLRVLRLSGQADELTVMLPESLTERCRVEEGKRLCVVGQLRSYNNRSGSGRKLVLSVYARTLCCCEGEEDCNEILLAGAICKPPVGRSTPLGREICDVLLAVNRRYGRADYIPCIAWGALAAEVGEREVGDTLAFRGRIQSREYRKTTPKGAEKRVAYEVSVMTLTEESGPEV